MLSCYRRLKQVIANSLVDSHCDLLHYLRLGLQRSLYYTCGFCNLVRLISFNLNSWADFCVQHEINDFVVLFCDLWKLVNVNTFFDSLFVRLSQQSNSRFKFNVYIILVFVVKNKTILIISITVLWIRLLWVWKLITPNLLLSNSTLKNLLNLFTNCFTYY